MPVLVIDNYDSFTYNLVQYLRELGQDVAVRRNDEADLDALAASGPKALVISPGPGAPAGGGVSVEAIRRFAGQIPVLGVGLGHLCIAAAFGTPLSQAKRLMHGKTAPVLHDGGGIYRGVPSPFEAACYHSLIVRESDVTDELMVTARTPEGEVMGLRHRSLPVEGVQFHPESIMTSWGMALLANFLEDAGFEVRREALARAQARAIPPAGAQ